MSERTRQGTVPPGQVIHVIIDGQPVEVTIDGQPITVTVAGQPIQVSATLLGQPIGVTINGQPIQVVINGQPIQVAIAGQPILVNAAILGQPIQVQLANSIPAGANTIGSVRTLVYDSVAGTWLPYEADHIIGDAIQIDEVHHQIHEQRHFTQAVIDLSVDHAAPKYVSLTAPNTTARIHFVAVCSASSSSLMQFFETPTITVAGTLKTPYNNDRNSILSTTLVVREDPTVTVDGIELFGQRIAGGSQAAAQRISGDVAQRTEWILKQNTTYTIKVTPDANGVEVSIVSTWYEVP